MAEKWSVTWLSEPYVYFRGKAREDPPPKILGCRRMEYSDIPVLERLIYMDTYAIFGDIHLGRIYEASCLSIVQYNEKRELISGICLSNYPNVPSVPWCDWLAWLKRLYGLESVAEMNTLFVHFLVWDKRYDSQFLGDLLTGLFDMAASYCLHVILVLPPRVNPGDVLQERMIRVSAKGINESYDVQSLYMTSRHLHNPRLRNRRLVEEDNDDVIPIINEESSLLKDLYGEYYISEMVRYPDGHRQLIVSEDEEGLATGIMCINSVVNTDILNENFELVPYNGLRKPHKDDEVNLMKLAQPSEILFPYFARMTEDPVPNRRPSREEYVDGFEDGYSPEENLFSESSYERSSNEEFSSKNAYSKKIFSDNLSNDFVDIESRKSLVGEIESVDYDDISTEIQTCVDNTQSQSTKKKSSLPQLENPSQITFLSYVPSTADYLNLYYHSRARTSVFTDALSEHSRRDSVLEDKIPGVDISEEQDTITLPYPTFHGDINVFALEIFALRKDVTSSHTRHFAEASFECYPDLNYCLVLVPFAHPYFSFLDHCVVWNLFHLRVPLKCNKDFPMALYLTHRAALLGDLKTRQGVKEDCKKVRDFLHGIPKSDQIMHDFERATQDHSELKSYVFECDGQFVGVTILCDEKRPEYLKRRYHIEDFISMQNIRADAHSRILHFILMPIFSIYHGQLLREVMRLSGSIVLYYKLYERDLSALTRSQPLITCLDSLIPINPRRRIMYKFRGYVETDELDEEENFSLFLTTPKLTTFPISVNDTRIVIVGASDCGVALAEYLAVGCVRQSIHFANVTIISPNGLPFENKRSSIVSKMMPFRGRYCEEYRNLVTARTWINVIYGTVVAINRKQKYVTVMKQGKLTYDYLILTCGLQYQKPMFEEEIQSQKKGKFLEFERPWNCLTVNDDTEAFTALEKIQHITDGLQQKKAIVFYGHSIDCYTALHGLLEFGVEGSCITLVEPALGPCEQHDDIFFNDCEVDIEIMNAIVRSGVNVLLGWNFVSWTLKHSEQGEVIKSIILEMKGKRKEIPCDAFFNFYEKTINMKIFLTICEAGLVFDGQLVIDPECRTNDPFIFAAGTITKYSRKFFADSWQHKYYNSIEVGERLAKILDTVIQTDQSKHETTVIPPEENSCLMLPVFRVPTIIACTLPGGYHYLHVRKAGKRVLRQVAIRHDSYGLVLVTGSCKSEIGYCRIRLNLYDSVETVTCLHKKMFEVHHMISLYGKHESMLNELKLHFRNSLIVDFYAYFREPWATALFYDRFECLQVENRATLLSKMPIANDSLVEDCIAALKKSNWESISEEDRRNIEKKFAGSAYHLEIEENLLDFLQFAEDDLPMYCTPRKTRWMYADDSGSEFFNTNL